MNDIKKLLVKSTLDKYPDLSAQVWAKVHYMVSAQCVGKFAVRNSPLVIDGSDQCTTKQMGLCSFGNQRLTKSTQVVLNHFNQGLTIDRDREGNIYCRSNSDAVSCPLEVIGWQTPHLHSLSPDIVRSKGRIDTKTIKVFDMCEYKSHVAFELQRQMVNHERLHQLSVFCISIIQTAATTTEQTDVEDAVPSNWLCIINLTAIDALTNEKVISDIKAMKHLDLIGSPEVQLRRNWSRQESQQRPHSEEVEEGSKGGKKARKGRKSKGDGGAASAERSWMAEEERTESRPTRRILTSNIKREKFPGERRDWSGLIGL